MDPQDGTVPAPRRPGLPLWRRSAPAGEPGTESGTASAVPPVDHLPFAVPAPDEAPRVVDLSALLADIDALRLTLQTDLSLAAAALEAGAEDLAGELVDGDLGEVRAFGVRAADHLQQLAALDAGEALPGPAVAEDEAPVPLRRGRTRRMLPAAPLVAAAALLGFFVGVVPDRPASEPGPAAMTSAALAGYELSRLADAGAPPEALRAAAEELNEELAVLIAQAAEDPAAAQQAMMLLQTTTEVLARQGDTGLLRGVMAEARALRKRLQETLPSTSRPGRAVRPPVRLPAVAVPRVEAEPEQRRTNEPAAKSASSPAPAPKPSPTATTAAPSPSPSPSPSAEPSSGPSEEPEDTTPLPGPTGPGLPGL